MVLDFQESVWRVKMERFNVRTGSRTDFVDITGEISKVVSKADTQKGICLVFVPHTTCGVTINENADPSVRADIAETLEKLIPWSGPYRHLEGNAAAHVKASLVGSSIAVPVEDGRLCLGTWQGIYLCEFDGPRTRNVYVQLLRSL